MSNKSKSAKFYKVKVAFEIPDRNLNHRMDGLDNTLMDMFEEAGTPSIVYEDVCNPDLLIIDMDDLPTKRWVAMAERKINRVLKDYPPS